MNNEGGDSGFRLSSSLVSAGNLIFFTSGSGEQLWRSDGMRVGTVRLVDGSRVTQLHAFGNRVYFAKAASGEGQELWSTDGTALGTHRIKIISPANEGSHPTHLTSFNNMFFAAARSSSS